jgi:hypothetical protein
MTSAGEKEAWVELLTEEESRRQMPPYYNYQGSFIPNFFRLVQAHSAIGAAFWPLQKEVLEGTPDSMLTASERELIVLVASVAQDCHY